MSKRRKIYSWYVAQHLLSQEYWLLRGISNFRVYPPKPGSGPRATGSPCEAPTITVAEMGARRAAAAMEASGGEEATEIVAQRRRKRAEVRECSGADEKEGCALLFFGVAKWGCRLIHHKNQLSHAIN